MKESTKFNTVLTLLNVAVIIFVLIGGAFHGNYIQNRNSVAYKLCYPYRVSGNNWSIDKTDLNTTKEFQDACLCLECRELEEVGEIFIFCDNI